MSSSNETEKEKKILDIVSFFPGVHASKVAELVHIPLSEVKQQLAELKHKGKVEVQSSNGFTQYSLPQSKKGNREGKTQNIRKKIYVLIQKNPGIHLSRIAKLLKISVSLADYHLMYMERHHEVKGVKDTKGYHKRYYLCEGEVGRFEKDLLEVLSRRVPLKVVLLFLQHPVMKHKDILSFVNVAPSTLSYYLNQLMQKNIIRSCTDKNTSGYELVNRAEIVRILKKYALHIELQLAAEGFRDLWSDFHY